jgi:hypothetical protein
LVNKPKLVSESPTKDEIRHAKRHFEVLEKSSPVQKVI